MIEAEAGEISAPEQVVLVAPESEEPEDIVWSFYARLDRWQSGAYDAKLLSIADDGPRRAIWMRCDTGAVFAPYGRWAGIAAAHALRTGAGGRPLAVAA